jgi:hypothetical protein
MKSCVAYPADFEKMLFPDFSENSGSGKFIAHYELYKKVNQLEGSIVKCGITAQEGLSRLSLFRNLVSSPVHEKVVAFEKLSTDMYVENSSCDNGMPLFKTTSATLKTTQGEQEDREKQIDEKITFIRGNVGDAIPGYLIENPDLKISYLNIDFDDYEPTLTTLQFFYPRIVYGGILILDNYYKKEEDYRAVNDYFLFLKITINNFSVNKGPHYVVRN